jgi:hypothetical protein
MYAHIHTEDEEADMICTHTHTEGEKANTICTHTHTEGEEAAHYNKYKKKN